MLIRAYRIRGHLLAKLDPLELLEKEIHPELDPASYGFTAEDYDRPIFINNVLGLETATLHEISGYCHAHLLFDHRGGIYAYSGSGTKSMDSRAD